MNQTPNARTPNVERLEQSTLALKVQRWAFDVLSGDSTSSSLESTLANSRFATRRHFHLRRSAARQFDPVQFASDIDNYKILPWPVSVALAFYLPWLEIFCALGLVFRFLYRGALSILTASIVVFTLATIAAKVRGLDITCGCFGHASQHWSFPATS